MILISLVFLFVYLFGAYAYGAATLLSVRRISPVTTPRPTEPGETDHFGVQAHIQALIDHVGPGVFDLALANSNDRPTHRFAPEWQGRTSVVPLDAVPDALLPIRTANVINPDNPLRHDPAKLAREIIRLLEEAGG